MLLTLKSYLWAFLNQVVNDPLWKRKTYAVKALGTLSYPVAESNHLRTPTENSSDTDITGRLPYPIPEENLKKKTELGETEATCTSCTETTATTAVSQDAASSTIELLVNRSSSSERCTPLSGIGKKLKQRKASEASRATGDLLQQRRCRDELKTSSALSAIGPSGKSCSPGLVTLTLRHGHLFNIFCWQYCDIWRAFYSQGLRCVRFGREARSSFPFRAFLRQAILENRA